MRNQKRVLGEHTEQHNKDKQEVAVSQSGKNTQKLLW